MVLSNGPMPCEAQSMLYFQSRKKCVTEKPYYNRRRIYTEEKEKFVAAVWGKEFISFLANL